MKITNGKDYKKLANGRAFSGDFSAAVAEGRQYRENLQRIIMMVLWSAVVDDEFEQAARELHDMNQLMMVLNCQLHGDIEKIAPTELLESFREWMRPGEMRDYAAIFSVCDEHKDALTNLVERKLTPLQVAELGLQIDQLLPSGVGEKQKAAALEACRQRIVDHNEQSVVPCTLRESRKIIRTTLQENFGSLVRRKQRQKEKSSKKKASTQVDVVPKQRKSASVSTQGGSPASEIFGISAGHDGRSITIHADQETIKDVISAAEALGKDYEATSKDPSAFRTLLREEDMYRLVKPNLSTHHQQQGTSKVREQAGQAAALLHCTLVGAAALRNPDKLRAAIIHDPNEISLTVDPDQGRIIRGRNQFKRAAGSATFAHDARGHWTLSDHGLRKLGGQGLSIKIRIAHSTDHEPEDQGSPVPSAK